MESSVRRWIPLKASDRNAIGFRCRFPGLKNGNYSISLQVHMHLLEGYLSMVAKLGAISIASTAACFPKFHLTSYIAAEVQSRPRIPTVRCS
jgi:hypothetical protein